MKSKGAFARILSAGLLTASVGWAGDIVIKGDKLEISGDLRLRHQTTEETGKTNRDRERFRLRLGLNFTVNPMLAIKTRIASGSSEQTSTNQTFENMASQKFLWIDQAYLELKPMPGNWAERFKLFGGRMQNPLWQTYASDVVWDTDLNPEGLAESVKLPVLGTGRFFVNSQQWVVNEKKAINDNDATSLQTASGQYLFSEQAGILWPTPLDSKVTLAAAIHDWVNETDRAMITTENTGGPDAGGKFESTNSNTSGKLNNDFKVLELGGEVFVPMGDIPVSVQGTYINNLAHRPTTEIVSFVRDSNGVPVTSKQNMGYQVGAQVGKASEPGTWELAYFRKYVEADATVASAADSDFPGTNRKGNIFWAAVAPWAGQQFKVKWFQTSIIKGAKKDIDLIQLDYQVKF